MENNENTGFAGQAAEKASQFAGQAKDLLSKVDTEKAMGATSKFMAGVFKFGKIVSALFMLLCIVTMIGALLYYVFAGPASFKAPVFGASEAEEVSSSGSSAMTDAAEKAEYRKVRDKFGKKVDAIVDLYGLKATDSDIVLKVLYKMDAEFRGKFVDGALAYGKANKKYLEKKGKGAEFGANSFRTYASLFDDAVEEADENKIEAKLSRQAALTVCGGSLLGLILFLFLPLLIQIEENTRK